MRALAREFGLAVADKPDSQDICFVPSGKYTDIIERLRPGAAEPGDIVHLDGRVLGRHAGVIHFTIGQRRGLGIGSGPAGGEPLYVVKLDPQHRRVIVGPRAALATRGDSSARGELDRRRTCSALCRRRASTSPCGCARPARRCRPSCIAQGDGARVEFCRDEDGVSPGQACVFYSSTEPQARVLGGGFIGATQSARRTTSDRP